MSKFVDYLKKAYAEGIETDDVLKETRMASSPYIVTQDSILFAKSLEAEVERLRAENEKLRDALQPFADYSDCLNEEEEETGNLAKDYDNQPVKIHYLRAAAAAIRESE